MNTIRCVIHGSFRKHFGLIKQAYSVFTEAGIEVLAPKSTELIAVENGFALFEGEENTDPRLIELMYLHNLKQLGPTGFSYFVAPEGYIGKSASYELGIAQISNVRCFYSERLQDHPAYIHQNSIWSPENLATYIVENKNLPSPQITKNDTQIHKLWEDLMVPGSVVAAGGIIEYQPKRNRDKKEILLVKTHKWGDRYSMVGGKVKRNERLDQALRREVKEETGLNSKVGAHICTFDQIKNSGYYHSGVQYIFVDNVVTVDSKNVILNEEAQDYIWAEPNEALKSLDIEPNAKHTLQLYANLKAAS
jgi:nucleoside triphosphatase